MHNVVSSKDNYIDVNRQDCCATNVNNNIKNENDSYRKT